MRMRAAGEWPADVAAAAVAADAAAAAVDDDSADAALPVDPDAEDADAPPRWSFRSSWMLSCGVGGNYD